MRSSILLCVVALSAACKPIPPGGPGPESAERSSWRQRAQRVDIVRDDWGVPHISAPTDADAVFGLMYAQCEDDFPRVETNLINALGRLAEAEGEAQLYRDLRMKLFIDPEELRALHDEAPPWLRALMSAWADGLNFYLATHPEVRPRVITRFEPWMALAFSEGSIGGDIERVSIDELAAFYGDSPQVSAAPRSPAATEPSGSNGFAIAPARAADGKALLLINPHTSFFFREEAQITSGEGLNAYGALTWGQFFVYQGFNDRLGWMHTSSGVDNIDEYLETVVREGERVFTVHGAERKEVKVKTIAIPYRTDAGMATREFTVYRSHHGPIIGKRGDRWVAVALMERPLQALMQSYRRTKARTYSEFREVMELHANSSNNTVYADADGNIGYFHANFVPRRDPTIDWTAAVDGASPRTAWRGEHTTDESPNVLNPDVGWVQNTNNWPYSAAGPNSPRAADFAPYFDTFGENPRGVHAVSVLAAAPPFTLDSLIAAAYDPHLPELAAQVPLLVAAWEQSAASPAKAQLAEPIGVLRSWDARWALDSAATSLAVEWAERLWPRAIGPAASARSSPYRWMRERLTADERLAALREVVEQLTRDFGHWRVPWGELNRFQRLSPELEHPFRDDQPSTPVGFAPGRWGSLASFVAPHYRGSKRRYGVAGNSFVAVVEFGARVRAKAVTAGGLSSDVTSPHFNDQAERYATGSLREVLFYPEQRVGHTERRYHPGS